MGNRDEIIRFLRTLFAAGDVFEIRVLNAVTASYQHPHAESGYFNCDHIPQAADSILALRSYTGAYVTLNPVEPALLARANNRLVPAKRDSSTADAEVLRRRWLPVDCDPVRPSGISSDDAEHEAALALAKEIRDGLSSLGWPRPVMLDSGNGAQMLYRVDLPADDGGLVRSALTEIAWASTDKVRVDLSVFNASRIWRIPGTMNCKGDPIPDRPHRMAKILEMPGELRTVGGELLRAVLPGPADVPPADSAPAGTSGSFDPDRWIAQYCPDAGAPVPWKGGRKWEFRVCPFNPEHSNRSAVITQQPDGEMGFMCQHNGCRGNDWHRLRELREPGYRHEPPPEILPIDWAALVAKATPEDLVVHTAEPEPEEPAKRQPQQPKKELCPDPGKLPDRLLHIPGFIDEFVDWSMASAPHPNRVLEFCGALAFLSYLLGRKVVSDRNTLPNIYLIALADSGAGKDHPRKVNMTTAITCGIGGGVVEDFTSGGGIEDTMYLHPSLLYQKDEMDTLFNVLKFSKDPNAETMLGKLLSIYGASNSTWKLRNKAMNRVDLLKMREDMQNGLDPAGQTIVNPYLVIFGTAIPQFFYESLSPRLLGNGMGARCILLVAGQRGPLNRSGFITLTDGLKRSIEVMRDYGKANAGNLSAITPGMMVLKATPGGDALLDECGARYDELYHLHERNREQIPMAFWARAYEKVLKLSMLYAVSAGVTSPVITEEAVRWAEEFVTFTTKQSLFLVSTYSYENPFDEKCQKVIRYIRAAGGSYAHADLLKRSHESKEIFDKIIDTLEENGTISHELQGIGRACRKTYLLHDGDA